MDVVVYFARSVVGVALLLSAGWKLRHKADFRTSYRALVRGPLGRLDGVASRTLPFIEIACGVGILSSSSLGRASSAAAFLLVLTFSLLLARAQDFRSGCGCWRTPAPGAQRAPHLMRNSCLLALSAVGSIQASRVSSPALVFCVGAGAVLALMIMEIPGVALVAYSQKVDQVR